MSIDIRHTWCGSHIPKPSMKLRAGSFSMLYENGTIRYVSAGGNEIIRMVYSAVRDREWLNVRPLITSERIERNFDSFRIEYTCRYISEEIDFSAKYLFEGKPDSTLIFSLEGEALRGFEKNRIGFCVLHPIEGCCGNLCVIIHSDGTIDKAAFPPDISPHQVFTGVRSMSWKSYEIDCNLEFSGDIFETEDQRNWSDASFKTYSTPLSVPFPARLEKGDKVIQSVIFRAENLPLVSERKDLLTEFSFDTGSILPLPKIGIGRSTRSIPLEDNEISIIKEIKFDHYRIDLFLFNQDWKEIAEMSVKESINLGYSLELALFFDENYREQSEVFEGWINGSGVKPALVTLFHKSHNVTPGYIADYVAPALRKSLPQILIIAGTNANFAQLNRQRPQMDNCDMVCYSIHPQEHASDNITLIENLQAQAYTASSAKMISGEKGVWISPVNIQRRFNANIENYEKLDDSSSLLPHVDNRMMSLFGACWSAGSIKYLCENGSAGITYFETAGERGIMQGNYQTRWPAEFRSKPGMIFPVFHIFSWLLSDKSFSIIKSCGTSPLKTDILALRKGNNIKIAVINPGQESYKIRFKDLNGNFSVLTLDSDSYIAATSDHLWIANGNRTMIKAEDIFTSNPYSVSFLEGKIDN